MAKKKTAPEPELMKSWPLEVSATLGSAVRMKGILLELRSKLPLTMRKSLDLDAGELTLVMPETERVHFRKAVETVTDAMIDIAALPVIPREIEDILTISTTERRRWLDDGRLPSAGTRTVRLRGRARKITFHVFDPRTVEDILDRGVVEIWREEDLQTAKDNRRRAAQRAKMRRAQDKSNAGKSGPAAEAHDATPELDGWDDFGFDGLLR